MKRLTGQDREARTLKRQLMEAELEELREDQRAELAALEREIEMLRWRTWTEAKRLADK